MSAVRDLEFITPDCTVCDGTTSTDGSGWWCDECGATWDDRGENGEAAS